jgi:hypothetical protein
MSDQHQPAPTPLLQISWFARGPGRTRVVIVSVGNGLALIVSLLAGSQVSQLWKNAKLILANLAGR